MSKLKCFVSINGENQSKCGYCLKEPQTVPNKTSFSFGMVCYQTNPEVYLILINKGWRRSGYYF